MFHGFFELILVQASISVDVVGGGIGTDFELAEKFGFDLLSEDLAVVFGVLEIDASDASLACHFTHFLLFLIKVMEFLYLM